MDWERGKDTLGSEMDRLADIMAEALMVGWVDCGFILLVKDKESQFLHVCSWGMSVHTCMPHFRIVQKWSYRILRTGRVRVTWKKVISVPGW